MVRRYHVMPRFGGPLQPVTTFDSVDGRAIKGPGRGAPMTPFERAEFADMEAAGETRRVTLSRILKISDHGET